MEIIGFLIAIVGSAIDPFRLLGYALAGGLIRKQGVAIAVGILWNLLLLVVTARMNQLSAGPVISGEYIIASLISACLVTVGAYAIAARRRAKRTP